MDDEKIHHFYIEKNDISYNNHNIIIESYNVDISDLVKNRMYIMKHITYDYKKLIETIFDFYMVYPDHAFNIVEGKTSVSIRKNLKRMNLA